MNKNVLDLFKNKKPIIAMLHLKGENDKDVLDRAKREIEIYLQAGIDAVTVENYYGNYYQMEQVLEYLLFSKFDIVYGVNCLNNDAMGFHLANKYKASFIQFDSVSGHLTPRDDYTYEAFINMYRKECDAFIFGGVRFKYQPYLSERTLREDLEIAKKRCDAIVVTGDATGQETSIDKIKEFRDILKDFPLIVGAGLTDKNCIEQLSIADAAIVGSYFKDTYKDSGDVDIEHVKQLLNIVSTLR